MKRRSLNFGLLLVGSSLALSACGLVPQRSPGEKLWRKLCAKCHGLDAAGNTPGYLGDTYADLRDNAWNTGGDRYSVETVVREGVFAKMPAHDELTREEMKALLDYFYRLRGESEP